MLFGVSYIIKIITSFVWNELSDSIEYCLKRITIQMAFIEYCLKRITIQMAFIEYCLKRIMIQMTLSIFFVIL